MKIWAIVTAESMAWMSENIVSVATDSFCLGYVKSWKPGFEVFPHGKSSGCDCPWGGISKVFLMVSALTQPKYGFNLL